MRMSAESMERNFGSRADASPYLVQTRSPDTFAVDDRHRSLARHCGMAWRDQALTPAHDVPFQQAMAAGIAGLDEAASGFRIAVTLARRSRGAGAARSRGAPRWVMLPPSVFRAMLRRQARDQVLDHASNHLARIRPGESARTGMTGRRGWLAGIVGGMFLLALWLSPQTAIAGLSLLITPLFFALIVFRLGAMIDGWLASPPRTSLLGDADVRPWLQRSARPSAPWRHRGRAPSATAGCRPLPTSRQGRRSPDRLPVPPACRARPHQRSSRHR